MSTIRILSGTASADLVHKVCERLSIAPGKVLLERFADGEIRVQLLENVRDTDVFIVNATHPPAENLLEMLLLADAARRSSAKRITLIPVYLGYNRQDRKDRPRVPISSRVVIDMLSNSMANRALLFDLHSEVTLGFFAANLVVDHLYASTVSIPYLHSILPDPHVVAAPDAGGVPRAMTYANQLDRTACGHAGYVLFSKVRSQPGCIEQDLIKIIGDVEGQNVLFVDDMIDTGTTLVADAEAAKRAGAEKIYAYATHALLSRDALERLAKSPIEELVTTDTIMHEPSRLPAKLPKVTVLSIAPLLAEAIRRIHEGDSLSSLILSG